MCKLYHIFSDDLLIQTIYVVKWVWKCYHKTVSCLKYCIYHTQQFKFSYRFWLRTHSTRTTKSAATFLETLKTFCFRQMKPIKKSRRMKTSQLWSRRLYAARVFLVSLSGSFCCWSPHTLNVQVFGFRPKIQWDWDAPRPPMSNRRATFLSSDVTFPVTQQAQPIWLEGQLI